jgi:glycosyltransferase involved in cell wall biosynthesis
MAEINTENKLKTKFKNIHFLGEDGDNIQISKFLNTIDIFAHGRKDGETFGAVFAEAMMHGKPCLSHYSPIANAQKETMGNGGLLLIILMTTQKNLKNYLKARSLDYP